MMPSLRGMETEPRIRIDVQENDKAYMIKADMPGVKKENIKISVDGSTVSLTATSSEQKKEKGGNMVRSERYYGEQYRSFSLPQEVDEHGAEAAGSTANSARLNLRSVKLSASTHGSPAAQP